MPGRVNSPGGLVYAVGETYRRIGAYNGSDSLPVEVAAVLGDDRDVTAPDEAAGVPVPSVGVSSTTLRFSPSAEGADGVSTANTAGDVDAATTDTAEEPVCSARSCRRRRMRSDAPIRMERHCRSPTRPATSSRPPRTLLLIQTAPPSSVGAVALSRTRSLTVRHR